MSETNEISDVELNEAQRMLAVIRQEQAKVKVQQIANGQQDTDPFEFGQTGRIKTYAERKVELDEAYDRLTEAYPQLDSQ